MELAIGAFDDAASIRPVVQLAVDAALPWVGAITDPPMISEAEGPAMQAH